MQEIKLKRIFTIIFLVSLVIMLIFFAALTTNQTLKIFFTTDLFKNMKEDMYNLQNKRIPYNSSVVFLGDSITEMYDLDKYYKDSDTRVLNRGISSETTTEVLDRLTMNVMSIAPKAVVILIGTNDLNAYVTPDEIVDNILKMVQHIHYFNADTKVYVESILPVNKDAYILSKYIVNRRTNEDIDYINSLLYDNAKYYNYTYIDTNSHLKNKDGVLDKEYTVDGLHISRAGYAVMTDEIRKVTGI